MTSPTEHSLAVCRKRKWLVDVVERSIFANGKMYGKHDLFNIFDLVAITPKGILGLQVTSASNVSARFRKLTQEHADTCRRWLGAKGLIAVWGWKKRKVRGKDGKWWELIVREITCDELAESD